jgi:hypothetical protein
MGVERIVGVREVTGETPVGRVGMGKMPMLHLSPVSFLICLWSSARSGGQHQKALERRALIDQTKVSRIDSPLNSTRCGKL